MSYICSSIRQLERNAYLLPNNLWTSSAGILWNRLLSVEVRKRGGTVTVFDHAHGANLGLKSFTPFIELQDVDTFVTFSSVHVEYIGASATDLVYSGCVPIILSAR